ncbi:MAG: hypothetical protein FJX02_10965 [Alphaproteobacteria bacterium]|nr:hypothetical protein [Alphaproteobacteria bacterium]
MTTLSAPSVSDQALAAWLDGRLSEAETRALETAMAADPALAAAARDLAFVLGQPLPAAPQRLVVRAQALVGFEAERAAARGPSLLAEFLFGGFRKAVQAAGVAVLAIVLSAGGFTMGGGLGTSYALDRQAGAAFAADPLSALDDLLGEGG